MMQYPMNTILEFLHLELLVIFFLDIEFIQQNTIFKKKYKRKLILLSYCESLKRLLLTMLMKIDCFQFEQQNPILLAPLCRPTLKPFVIKSFFPPTEKHNARNSRPPFLMGLSHSKSLSRATKYKLCVC